MGKSNEPGVLLESDLFFHTPSTAARQLFYYVTRCGHYYCTPEYHFLDSCPDAQLPGHRTYAIHYICSGSIYEENAAENTIALPKQVSLLDCSCAHHFYAREATEFLWIHLDGSNIKDFFTYLYALNGKKRTFTPPNPARTKAAMLQIINAFRLPGQMNESELSQCVYRLLCDLIIMPQETEAAAEADVMPAVLDYITLHLFEDISVRSIADAAELSSSHFSRLFKLRTGYSPHEYITLRRIDAAKDLLRTTPLSVREIAQRVGYHSEANFITAFSKKTGLTPALFRRNPF